MKLKLLKMKADLKVLAAEIRKLKSTRKQQPNGYVYGLLTAQLSFRAKHIAYCMLRGRTLEQIEPSLRDPNDSNHHWARKEAARILNETMASEGQHAEQR